MKTLGFDLNYGRLVTDAANLCRWNPSEALKWFEHARNRASSELQILSYNRAVSWACQTLDSIERAPYYRQEDFWGEDVQPSRPESIPYEVNVVERRLRELDSH